MIKYFDRPYKIFFGFSIVMILTAVFFGLLYENSTIDVQLHDTYFAVNFYYILIIAAVFQGLIGGIYWLFRKIKLVFLLTGFHVLGSILPFFPMIYLFTYLGLPSVPRRYYSFASYDFEGDFYRLLFVLIFIFLAAQLLLVLNILIGGMRYWKERNIEK